MKTAQEILNAKYCGDLFSKKDEAVVKAEYRALSKEFHPDVSTDENSHEVFVKLGELYRQALDQLRHDTWQKSNQLYFQDTKGKKYACAYLKQIPFELGEAYLSEKSVVYIFDAKHKRYYENAVSQISGLKYANAEMEAEIFRYMPSIRFYFQDTNGRFVLILNKNPDVFLLSDVLRFYGGHIPDRHAAWMLSRLCNICCYFDYAGISHNGLTLDTCFVCPEYHTILPLGGWQYAKPIGEKLIGISRSVYDVMPIKAKSDKISTCQTDHESVKLIGRQIIDASSAPKQIVAYVNAGSIGDAKKEFTKWNAVLDAAYGQRKFVEMKIDRSKIYQ